MLRALQRRAGRRPWPACAAACLPDAALLRRLEESDAACASETAVAAAAAPDALLQPVRGACDFAGPPCFAARPLTSPGGSQGPCWQQLQQRQLASDSRSPGGDQGPAVRLPQTWLDRYLPAAAIPYALTMRMDKPIGTWLLAWPGFWSIAAAAGPGQLPDARLLACFAIGAVLLRGAGCTVNDLWDRDLDARVARTRSRPLASGALTPLQGLGLLGGQLLLGLGVLLQLNSYSILLGAASLGLVITYPLMKRVTDWPQAYLGLTFNWGALLGYAAVAGACHWPTVLPLYLGGVCWTLVYDTIYAHQDKQDDVAAGVRSTALLFGSQTRAALAGFAAAATGLWGSAGVAMGAGLPFYTGVAAAGAHMAWQIRTVDLDDRGDCMAKFVSNKWLGGLLFGGIVADKLLL